MKQLQAKLQTELTISINGAMENYTRYLTVKESEKVVAGVKPLESYRAKIESKVTKGYTGQYLVKLEEVAKEDRGVQSLTVTVTYTKSPTWGFCPVAELTVRYTNGDYDRFLGERAGGCGYDKESTAIASAFNQCNALLNALYTIKDTNIEQSNHQCLGYGSGYGVLPSFEGGVGFNCHRNLLEKLGFTYAHTASGKAFDVYSFSK